MTHTRRPLGIFDSGVGGLTVARAILARHPDERVVYVADQAHVPYGGRPLEEVRGYASEISRFLAARGCRAVVMACNISSATALEPVRAALHPLPILGMIAPAAREAIRCAARTPAGDGPRAVGILATDGTVRSGAYSAAFRALDARVPVTESACPAFVPLIEDGRLEGLEVESAARTYLAPLAAAGCDVIVLGCTHYPFVLPVLRRIASGLFVRPVTFVDPAECVAAELASRVSDLARAPAPTPAVLFTTGSTAALARQLRQFLPSHTGEVRAAAWSPAGTLHAAPEPVGAASSLAAG